MKNNFFRANTARQKVKLWVTGVTSILAGVWLTIQLCSFQVADAEISMAQTWFEHQYPSVSFRGVEVSPIWSQARKVTSPQGQVQIEVPLDKTFMADIGKAGGDGASSTDGKYANGRVSLIIAKSNGVYVSGYFQINASHEYIDANGQNAVNGNTFDHINKNFSGIVQYLDMSGRLIQGIRLVNAQPTTILSQSDGLNSAHDRGCWEVINTYWQLSSEGYRIFVTVTTHIECDNDTYLWPVGYFMPDGWGEGIYNASAYWWAFQNDGINSTNPNNNNNEPPGNGCCTVFSDKKFTNFTFNTMVCLKAYVELSSIKCQEPNFNGSITFDACQDVVQPPFTYQITHNNVYLKRKVRKNNCGWDVVVAHEADATIYVGLYPYFAVPLQWMDIDGEIEWTLK